MGLNRQDIHGIPEGISDFIFPEDDHITGSLIRDTLAVSDFVAEERVNSSPLTFESNLIVTSSVEFQKDNIAFTGVTFDDGWSFIGYTLPHRQGLAETMTKMIQLKIQEKYSGTKTGFALWKELDAATAVSAYGEQPSDAIISTIVLPDDIPLSNNFMSKTIILIKDSLGNPYLPEFGFNGIGDMNVLDGYQIKLESNDFIFGDSDFGETFRIPNLLVDTPLTIPALVGSGNELLTREELIAALDSAERDFNPGWNFLGFSRLYTENTSDVLEEFLPNITIDATAANQEYPAGYYHSGSGTVQYAPYDFDTVNSTLTTTQRDNEIINTGSRLYGTDLDKVYFTGLENWITLNDSSIIANKARNIYIDHNNTRHELLRLDPYIYNDVHGDYILTSVIDLPVTNSIEDSNATLPGTIIFTEGMNGGPSGSNSEVETYLNVHAINSEEHETHYPVYHNNWDVEQVNDPNINYNIVGVNMATVHGSGTQFTKDFIGEHNAFRHIYGEAVNTPDLEWHQVIELTAGWNLISTYIDMTKAPYSGYDVAGFMTNHLYTAESTSVYGNNAYLVPDFTDHILLIKNVTGEFWEETATLLHKITNTEGFMIYSTNSDPMYLHLQGKIIQSIGVDLHVGWNFMPIHHPIGLPLNQFFEINNQYDPEFEASVHLLKNVTGDFWSPTATLINELNPGQAYAIYMNKTSKARFYPPSTIGDQFRKGTKFAFDTLGRKYKTDVIRVVNDELMYVKSVTTGETDPLSQTDSDIDTSGQSILSFRDDGSDETTYNNTYTQSGHITLDRSELTLSGSGTQFTKIFKSGSLVAFDFTSSVSTSNGASAFDFQYRNWARIKHVESDVFAYLTGMNAQIRADLHPNIENNWTSEPYLSGVTFANPVTFAFEPVTVTTPWYYTTSAETSFYYTNRYAAITSSAYLGEVKLRRPINVLEDVTIMKNGLAQAILPEWNFNGIGDMVPGQGYQIKFTRGLTGVRFPTHSSDAFNTPLIDQ